LSSVHVAGLTLYHPWLQTETIHKCQLSTFTVPSFTIHTNSTGTVYFLCTQKSPGQLKKKKLRSLTIITKSAISHCLYLKPYNSEGLNKQALQCHLG